MSSKKYLFPLILVTSLFFLWAFLHNINPILIPHLKKACSLTDTQSSFIDLSVYFAYFIMALPAGLYIQRFSYKNGIITGLCLYALGAFLFVPAAAERNYWLFLVALFIIASGATFLEAIANPYITLLGDRKNAAQRLNMAQSFNGLGAFIAPLIGGKFILTGIEHTATELKNMTPNQLGDYLRLEADTIKIPYIVIGVFIIILIILFLFTKLPDVNAADQDNAHAPDVKGFNFKVLRHTHFKWAVIAQFFYVGAQVGVGSFFIRYSKFVAGINEKQAALYWGGIAMVGFMAGRFLGTFLMRYIKPNVLLSIYAAINVALLIIAISTNGNISVGALIAVPFFMSIMYPTIFALGIDGLGNEAKIGASLLVMAIIGGAVAPLVMGFISDITANIQYAYSVPLVCFIVVLYYGLRGHSKLHNISLNQTL